MEHMIEVSHLTKDYGQGRGVYDVSFFVDKGECFGFLGPNGAGKSTTIRHLMGFSIPDEGKTYLNGKDSHKNRNILMQNVAYVPGEVALPNNLKGYEVIKESMELKGIKDTSMLDWLIKTFEWDGSLYVKEMSLGMKRKTSLISAFLSDPEIIILDEPSSGLDPEMQERFIKLLETMKQRGKTILLSSHIFKEVEASCDRISIIKDGKIVSTFTKDELKHSPYKKYLISFKSNKEKEKTKKTLIDGGYEISEREKNTLLVSIEDCRLSVLLNALPSSIVDFKEEKETLEDRFMSFYKEENSYGGITK